VNRLVSLGVILFGGVLLLGLVSMAAGQQDTTPFVWPTAPPPPLPFCQNVVRNRLILYERGRVSYEEPEESLNIREGPSTNFDIAGEIPMGGVFVVLDGPECSPTYTWFYVRYRDSEGWVAEGTIGDVYYVEPYPPG
jgi:uncharacterized protein YgiM (DUF1202 family)